MVAVFSAVPEELAVAEGEEAAAAGALLELAAPGFAELPHAAVMRVMATSPAGAHSIFRIACLRTRGNLAAYLPPYATPRQMDGIRPSGSEGGTGPERAGTCPSRRSRTGSAPGWTGLSPMPPGGRSAARRPACWHPR